MFAGFGTAEETNQRFKYLLQQGQTGLSVAFDLPTLMGYDTDAPEALGEFGKCGVAVSSLVPTLPLQAFAAATVAGINGGLSLLARAPSGVRRAGTSAMKAFAPAGGPAEDRLAAWTWSIECEARGAQGALSRARVEATGHPGYLATSRMTAEAGLMLADTGAQTPDVAGVLTPEDVADIQAYVIDRANDMVEAAAAADSGN